MDYIEVTRPKLFPWFVSSMVIISLVLLTEPDVPTGSIRDLYNVARGLSIGVISSTVFVILIDGKLTWTEKVQVKKTKYV